MVALGSPALGVAQWTVRWRMSHLKISSQPPAAIRTWRLVAIVGSGS